MKNFSTTTNFSTGLLDLPKPLNRRTLALLRNDVALDYALGRGLTLRSIQHFDIGFFEAEKFSHLYSDRIVFPIEDLYGNFITYQSRAIPGVSKIQTPKYWHGEFPKDQHLYGLHRAIPLILEHQCLCVVEGPIDVAVLWEFGVPAVATLGTAFSETHALLIKRFTDNVYIWRDNDEAGERASVRSTGVMHKFGMRPTVFSHKTYKDPSEMFVKCGYNKTKRYINDQI